MNWDAIGAIGEIVGAIAVIATLVYLARQMSQSVDLARSSQNRGLMESYESYNELILGNPEVAELLAKLENRASEVSQADNIQIRHLAYRLANIYASAQLTYSNGQLRAEEFAMYKMDLPNVLDHYPGLLPYFMDILRRYPAFQEFEIYAHLNAKVDGEV